MNGPAGSASSTTVSASALSHGGPARPTRYIQITPQTNSAKAAVPSVLNSDPLPVVGP